MHVHPAVTALQGHPALQRRSQAFMDTTLAAWLDGGHVQALRGELARYDRGNALEHLPGLRLLITDHGEATDFAQHFCSILIEVLRAEPLTQVPLRHSANGGYSRLQLLQSGGVALSLCAYEPSEPQVPMTAQFVDSEVRELVLAGNVQGLMHSIEGGGTKLRTRPKEWRAGSQITGRPRLDARHFVRVGETALVLQLTRTPAQPMPIREHSLIDGALIQQTSGDKRASEQVMALSVLGAMEHRAAIGAMVGFAGEADRDSDARWEAVRQVLALDSVCGLSLLAQLGSSTDDPLSEPANALRDSLFAANPQLRRYERENS